MKSKTEVIRQQLAHLRVLDLGGAGYGDENDYEREIRKAWSFARTRTTVDWSERADFRINLNQLPLPRLARGQWDITTAFDVLEHLEHPGEVLKWVPTDKLIVSLPNVLSMVSRRMEQTGYEHLYNFTAYTATVLLRRSGWRIDRCYYTFGKWSPLARFINAAGSILPSRVGTGIMLHCSRI